MGGVLFGELVGYLLDNGSGYGVVFGLAGSLHILAFVALCLIIPSINPLEITRESRDENKRNPDTRR